MNRSRDQRRARSRATFTAGKLWMCAAVLAAAGVFILSNFSAVETAEVPDPPFAVFNEGPEPRDELPGWVELDTGREEVRFLTTSGTGSYYVSRGGGGYCLVVLRAGPGESYSAFCRSGPITAGGVVSGTSPGTTLDGRAGMAVLVVDGHMDGAELDGGMELIHPNVLVKLGVPQEDH